MSLEINIPIPPPDDNESDWHMVPDESGKLYLINENEVLSEIQPSFNFDKDVIFELYTLKNQDNPQKLHINDHVSLITSHYNVLKPTRIVVHGYNSHGELTKSFRQGLLILKFFLNIY